MGYRDQGGKKVDEMSKIWHLIYLIFKNCYTYSNYELLSHLFARDHHKSVPRAEDWGLGQEILNISLIGHSQHSNHSILAQLCMDHVGVAAAH